MAGRVAGGIWILGGISVALGTLLANRSDVDWRVLGPLCAVAVIWGACRGWLLDWTRTPRWATHATMLAAVAVGSAMVAAGGGSDSVAWPTLLWLALYALYFYAPSVSFSYLIVIAAAVAAPLAYDTHDTLHNSLLGTLLVTAACGAPVAVALVVSKRGLVRRRESAEAQALTDSLTGLANHRELQRALAELNAEGAALSHYAVAVVDIDDFKAINDAAGHEYGDGVLVAVAACLRQFTEAEEVLARSGGDEFTWLMPRASATEARDRIDAVRKLLGRQRHSYRITLSAGVCDERHGNDANELIRLADAALYWSKSRGRDRCQVYDPVVVDALSPDERASRLKRSQAMLGLRALAQAIDAKDPDTLAHSERVAELVLRLALAGGWEEDSALALRDAALVHDVGKIGVDDALLHKPEKLTDAERGEVHFHAELSARITTGVLSEEQVSWVRCHHERFDGRGYPAGLIGAEIPDGAALLSVADAFDVMTSGRAYSPRRSRAEALAECHSLSGTQFSPDAVALLERVVTLKPEIVEGPVSSVEALAK
ncbi:MAG: diguanylate cyclase [Solirubrobacterales bacterium]|nr:diguanylate cyclase [Solirubrobacterales bacterium]